MCPCCTLQQLVEAPALGPAKQVLSAQCGAGRRRRLGWRLCCCGPWLAATRPRHSLGAAPGMRPAAAYGQCITAFGLRAGVPLQLSMPLMMWCMKARLVSAVSLPACGILSCQHLEGSVRVAISQSCSCFLHLSVHVISARPGLCQAAGGMAARMLLPPWSFHGAMLH